MKETLDNLHVQLCEELNEYSHRGIKNHEDLDVVKDLLSSIKNIHRIKEYMEEDTNWEEGDMGQNSRQMRRMYSNKYYPMDGNSYTYNSNYDPYHKETIYTNTPVMRGYSGATKEEMIDNLKKMVEETNYQDFKEAISTCIAKLEK